MVQCPNCRSMLDLELPNHARQVTVAAPNASNGEALCMSDLLGWLRGKLTDAERSLAAREQAAECWNSGTDEEWAESAKLHPATAKAPPLTKAARMANARREEQIAAKCRREVQNFKDVLAALSHPNH